MWLEITGLALLYSVKQVMEFTEVLGITDKCFKSNRFFFKPLSFQLYSWTKSLAEKGDLQSTHMYTYMFILKKLRVMCIYRYCVWNKWARTCLPCSLFTYKAVVNPEKGHLTGLVEQVGKSYEGIGCVQVQDEHSSDEGHSLHLKNTQTQSQYKRILTATLKPVTVRACTCQML